MVEKFRPEGFNSRAASGEKESDLSAERVASFIASGDFDKLPKGFSLTQEEWNSLTSALIETLRTDASMGARLLLWYKDSPHLLTWHVLDAARESVLRELEAGHAHAGLGVLKALWEVERHSSPVRSMVDGLRTSGDVKRAVVLGLGEGILEYEAMEGLYWFMSAEDRGEVRNLVMQLRLKDSLRRGDIDEFFQICSSESVPRSEVASILRQVILSNVESGDIDAVLAIRARVVSSGLLPRGFFSSEEVIAPAVNKVDALLRANDIDGAARVHEGIRIPDDRIRRVVEKKVAQELALGNYEAALDILKKMKVHFYQMAIDRGARPALLRLFEGGNADVLNQFSVSFSLESAFLDPDIQQAAWLMLERNMDGMDASSVLDFIRRHGLKSSFVTEGVREKYMRLLEEYVGHTGDSFLYNGIDLAIERFGLSEGALGAVIRKGIRKFLAQYSGSLSGQRIESIAHILQARGVALEDISDGAEDVWWQNVLHNLCKRNDASLVLRFLDVFRAPEGIVFDSSVREAAVDMIEKTMPRRASESIAVAKRFALEEDKLRAIGCRALYKMLTDGIPGAGELVKKMHISREYVVENLGAHHPVLIFFDESISRNVRYAAETYARDITIEHQRARLTHCLSPNDYRRIIERNPDLREHADLDHIFDALIDFYLSGESDESVEIGKAMQNFASVFGKDIALQFANRPDLSYDNAFSSARAAIDFAEINGVREGIGLARFCELLLQVAKDDRRYESGTANHEWNRVITQMASQKVEDIVVAADMSSIPELRARVDRLRTGRFNPLRSWRGLRDCADISTLLERRELLDVLSHDSLSPSLRNYGGVLLQHPTIDLEALRQLLSQPEEFLSRDAAYVDEAHQEKMNPAHLFSRNRISLSPESVRDALADGRLDSLQEIASHDSTFFFDREGVNTGTEEYVRNAFIRAIGQKSLGISGEAASPRALFDALRKFGVGIQRDMLAWLQSPPSPEVSFSNEQLNQLRSLLYGRSGIKDPSVHEVRVRVGRKDDAHVLAAMNDAASCMPFGDGKTNVYLWNPNCAFLVVERRTDEGWRTMAQSVLMKDMDIGRETHEVMDTLKRGGAIHELLGAESVAGVPVLTCDNIEPAASEISAGRAGLIECAYREFLPEYIRMHAADMGIDARRVIIGKESYDTRRAPWGFEVVDNTFFPAAPISYSDNSGPQSYILRIDASSEEASIDARDGIFPVRASDALAVAYAEGKSFNNSAMIEGIFKIHHRIVAQMISRETYGDPDLSFISRTTEGKPAGYILAGVGHDGEVPEVYIADFAVDRSLGLASARHAVKILDRFLEAFVEFYKGNDGTMPDIYAEMREDTSYRLLENQGRKIANKYGLSIRISEEGSSVMGGETMRHIRISMGRS